MDVKMNWRDELKEMVEILAFVGVSAFFVFDMNGYFDKEKKDDTKTGQKKEIIQKAQVMPAPQSRDSVAVFRPDTVAIRAAQHAR